MSSKSKENIKLGASTLISNDACIEMGRTRHWYSALIAGLLAVVFAIIPTMTSQLKLQGQDILSSAACNLDQGLVKFAEHLEEYKADSALTIDSSTHKMTVMGKDIIFPDNSSWTYNFNDKNYFRAYWTDEFNSANYSIDENKIGSFVVFYEEGFYVNKNGSSLLTGQYDWATETVKLNDFVRKNLSGDTYSVTFDNKTQDTYNEYYNNSLATWKEFFNESSKTFIKRNAWTSIGFYSGIFALFIVFMGFLLWILTRGKANPYRVMSFWDTQKIAYWSSVTPGILGMILGFILGQSMYLMGFIFTFGIRLMWLSMKTTAPQQR